MSKVEDKDLELGLELKRKLRSSMLKILGLIAALLAWTALVAGLLLLFQSLEINISVAFAIAAVFGLSGWIFFFQKIIRTNLRAITCPKCGSPYNWGTFGNVPFARKCQKCGLPIP